MLLGVKRFNALLVSFVFAFSALLLLRRLIHLTNLGGGEFQHADWLVNFSSGIVRRGISGEFFLTVSQWLNVSPLILVSTVQGLLTIVLITALFAKALTFRMSDLTVVLLLSPALVLFWVNDTTGAFRKELLALTAFLPLLFARTSGPGGILAVVAMFSVSVFFHEGNLILTPALSVALFFRLGRAAIMPVIGLWLIGLLATIYAISFASVPDTVAMCGRLLEAGLSDRLCFGIFPWLEDGVNNTTSAVKVIVLDRVNWSVLALFIILMLLPGLWIASYVLRGRMEWTVFLISIGSIFALYPIATDWSRWLSLQVFVMTFLVMLLAESRDGLERPLPKSVYGLVLAFCLGVGIDQIAPEPLRGFVFNVVHAVGVVFG